MSTTTVTKRCECGNTFTVEVPDSLKGAFRAQVLRWTVLCQACDDEQQAEKAARARELEARSEVIAYKARLRRCGIPNLYRELRWESVDRRNRQKTVDAAMSWAAGVLPGLVLTGDVGVGKTYLAGAAAWEFLGRRSLRWTSVPGLMAALAADWNNERRRAALELIDGTEALVLDDLDKTRPSPYAAEQLFGAIDARVSAGASLLVTTNLTLSELVEKYPDPFGHTIVSRLAGYCQVRGLTGVDRRRQRLVSA